MSSEILIGHPRTQELRVGLEAGFEECQDMIDSVNHVARISLAS